MSESKDTPGPKSWPVRFIDRHFSRRDRLEHGLRGLEAQLGVGKARTTARQSLNETIKRPTHELARGIFYAPDMDGQAEPGEVVWANLHFVRQVGLERRAVMVIGRNHHTLLGLLISSDPRHADDGNWFPIGNGPWSDKHDTSWVRMDKTLLIPETFIQRRGVRMPIRRFERLASALRQDYGWK